MRAIALSLLTLLSAGVVSACSTPPVTPIAGMMTRMRASSVGFEDLDGAPASLDVALGHPVVLAFLGPDDGDSQADVPLLLRLAGAYEGEGLQVIAVGERASVQALRDFQASEQLTFPLWQDPGAAEWSGRGFGTLPAFQFIDAQGGVQSSAQGFLSRGELTAQIEALFGRGSTHRAGVSRAR